MKRKTNMENMFELQLLDEFILQKLEELKEIKQQ